MAPASRTAPPSLAPASSTAPPSLAPARLAPAAPAPPAAPAGETSSSSPGSDCDDVAASGCSPRSVFAFSMLTATAGIVALPLRFETIDSPSLSLEAEASTASSRCTALPSTRSGAMPPAPAAFDGLVSSGSSFERRCWSSARALNSVSVSELTADSSSSLLSLSSVRLPSSSSSSSSVCERLLRPAAFRQRDAGVGEPGGAVISRNGKESNASAHEPTNEDDD